VQSSSAARTSAVAAAGGWSVAVAGGASPDGEHGRRWRSLSHERAAWASGTGGVHPTSGGCAGKRSLSRERERVA
jgi:hypothetical protein